MILSEILSEAALSFDEIKIENNTADKFLAHFTVGEYRIIFKVIPSYIDEDMMIDMVEMVFEYQDKNGNTGKDVLNVGYGFARTVVDTIVKIALYYVDRHAPSIIFFSATGRGRIAVYDRLSSNLRKAGYIDVSQNTREYNNKPVKNYYFADRFIYKQERKLINRYIGK